jgi:hypothetical protein
VGNSERTLGYTYRKGSTICELFVLFAQFCINKNIGVHKARERVGQMMEIDAFNVALSVECINELDTDMRGVSVTNEMVTISNEGCLTNQS